MVPGEAGVFTPIEANWEANQRRQVRKREGNQTQFEEDTALAWGPWKVACGANRKLSSDRITETMQYSTVFTVIILQPKSQGVMG